MKSLVFPFFQDMTRRSTLPVVACLTLTILACSLGSPAPTGGATAQGPEAGRDDLTPTAPVVQNPTSTTDAPLDDELSESDILQIVRASLAAYPWRLDQSVVVKGTGQTSTTLTEAQSSTRGYNQSVENLGTETITIESIIIDSLVYVKMTGSPSATYGLVDGQWTELPPGSPLLQLVDTGAIDPARVADFFATDFASLRGDGNPNELLFMLAGSETLNGVATNIYESEGATFTYRWWIGADQRFYKTTVDLPEATRTIVMDYDPGITVQPPIP
ncbi:MAG TPA: hypothetical protein VGX03_31345 [Candidatus Binatia bacterium]|nr:hypothetical protein [Candidatus Binatia bacterium]